MQKHTLEKAMTRMTSIMARLRSPQGCPWDAEQTPESLKAYLLEETYEVLEAIDRGETGPIREELGDLLLQIVFQARIFEERGEFDLAEVAGTISDKLVRRHPHVFGDQPVSDMASLDAQWNRIKTREKEENGRPTSTLSGIPKQLPALLRARKIAEKTDPGGYDVPRAIDLSRHLADQFRQLEKTLEDPNPQAIENHFGDLLFRVVRLGSFLGIDSEDALRRCLDRFTSCVTRIETLPARQDRSPGEISPDDFSRPNRKNHSPSK